MAKRKREEKNLLDPERIKKDWLEAKDAFDQAETRLKFERALLEQAFPPGTDIPDFPYKWSETNKLEVLAPNELPDECFSRVPDNVKIRAWQKLREGTLPPGTNEKTEYRLIQKKD